MEGVRYVLEPLEVMHHVQLVLEVMIHALEVMKGVWKVVFCVLEALDNMLYVQEVLEVLELMRCMLLLYILPGEIAAELGWVLPQFCSSFSTLVRTLSIRCF